MKIKAAYLNNSINVGTFAGQKTLSPEKFRGIKLSITPNGLLAQPMVGDTVLIPFSNVEAMIVDESPVVSPAAKK